MGQGLSRREFLQSLKESNLLSAPELERAAAAHPDADGRGLAHLLASAGVLSTYQAEAVCLHKHRELLIGNYEVLDRIGAGGMGTVFKARHRRMKRIVALKVLSRDLIKDDLFVQRFQREVEVIAQLNHPNVVMAFDADEDKVGHFLVMEFVDGNDLATLVRNQGPFEVADALNCILQAARGLEYAHLQGIIHRDVKPANLLRDTQGVVKVTDLGLARFQSSSASPATPSNSLTQAGGILGTADYMSPEQATDSTSIDHRADIYSLGASLYFLLAGQGPYQGSTLMATLWKHREAPIPSLIEARNDVPPALDAIFQQMLAKKPGQRQGTMSEVVRALENVRAGHGGAASFLSPIPAVSPMKPPASVRPRAQNTFVPHPAETSQTVDIRPPSTHHGTHLMVMLVEPSRAQAGIIRKYLQAMNIDRVVTAATGEEALKLAREDRPDAIISALHLTDMTGIRLAQQVREEVKGAAPGFVLISSESETQEAGLLSQAGQAVILPKPFGPEDLVRSLSLASRQFSSLKLSSDATSFSSLVTSRSMIEKPSEQPVGPRAPRRAMPTMPARPPSPPSPPSSTVERGSLRALIVDDSASSRAHIRGILKALGFAQIDEAADGAQAVAAVARDTMALIVTDFNMPHMDGLGLVGYLRQNPATASVPIIMVTTEKDPRKLDPVRRLGVTAICDKSFPLEEARQIIDHLWQKT